MRRRDAFPVLVLGALALFVGTQIFARHASGSPRRERPAPPNVAMLPSDTVRVVGDQHRDIAVATVRSDRKAPARDDDDIRARIAAAPGTYMSDMLVDLNGELVRWPDRREQGLRVWVQSLTSVADWDPRYAQMARGAFDDWGGGGIGLPIRFDFVLDSAASDIQVLWVERFAPSMGLRVGTTKRTNDQHGWLVAAQIAVAIHDSAGRVIPPADLAGIVRHEAGHALGLGHSRDPRTKMYPTEVVSDITPADRATLRLLYQLPPGVVR